MLVEKKTLCGPPLLRSTGSSAVSPGHWPFCARASISVPGAPASSLLTGSHVFVSNSGVEICAPVCVATALLCTIQPADPRFTTSLAPVSDGAAALASAAANGAAPPAGDDAAASGAAWTPDASQTRLAETTATAQRADWRRMVRLIAGISCSAADGRERRAPPLDLLVRILSKQICQDRTFGPGRRRTSARSAQPEPDGEQPGRGERSGGPHVIPRGPLAEETGPPAGGAGAVRAECHQRVVERDVGSHRHDDRAHKVE